jgi:hypothetical protein
MDRPPFPVSAPTPQRFLNPETLPEVVVRLRLFIDAKGAVVGVEIQSPEKLEELVSNQIKEMLFATTFIPGNIRGIDLPCYMDIELDIANYIHQH